MPQKHAVIGIDRMSISALMPDYTTTAQTTFKYWLSGQFDMTG